MYWAISGRSVLASRCCTSTKKHSPDTLSIPPISTNPEFRTCWLIFWSSATTTSRAFWRCALFVWSTLQKSGFGRFVASKMRQFRCCPHWKRYTPSENLEGLGTRYTCTVHVTWSCLFLTCRSARDLSRIQWTLLFRLSLVPRLSGHWGIWHLCKALVYRVYNCAYMNVCVWMCFCVCVGVHTLYAHCVWVYVWVCVYFIGHVSYNFRWRHFPLVAPDDVVSTSCHGCLKAGRKRLCTGSGPKSTNWCSPAVLSTALQ